MVTWSFLSFGVNVILNVSINIAIIAIRVFSCGKAFRGRIQCLKKPLYLFQQSEEEGQQSTHTYQDPPSRSPRSST